MHKIFVVMLCGWLLASAALFLQGTENVSAPTDRAKSGVFNVLNYGAVADDKTDNTEAFSKCLTAIIAAGGGRMYLPEASIADASSFRAPSPGSRSKSPASANRLPSLVRSDPFRSPVTARSAVPRGVGSRCDLSGKHTEKLYATFSGVNVVIRNLDVRTYDNPGIGGIDLKSAAQCKLENVFVNTGLYNVQAAQPTHGTCGLITPARDNAALTVLRNVVVTGYHTGIQVNEHTDGDNIVVASNRHGLEFLAAHHASRFARSAPTAIRTTSQFWASTGFHRTVEYRATRKGQTDASNAWQTLRSDINDPQNLGSADINYWVVVGGVGAVDQFTKDGGSSIRARRIGSAPTDAMPTPE